MIGKEIWFDHGSPQGEETMRSLNFLIVSRFNPQRQEAEVVHYTTYLRDLLLDFGDVTLVNPQKALEMAKKVKPGVIILVNWKTESSAGDPPSPKLVRSLKTELPQVKIVLDPPCPVYQTVRQSSVRETALESGVSVVLERHLSEPLTINAYRNAEIF